MARTPGVGTEVYRGLYRVSSEGVKWKVGDAAVVELTVYLKSRLMSAEDDSWLAGSAQMWLKMLRYGLKNQATSISTRAMQVTSRYGSFDVMFFLGWRNADV
jgi:hypothetical protein